jgi:hypothetical protein
VAAQAPVTGRWHVRIQRGGDLIRGELRLVQTGARLAGTLALENSDSAPAPIRDGAVQADGGFAFRTANGEDLRFTGAPGSDGLGGLVTSGSRRWSWSARPLAEGAEFYAALPRFRASQLLIGRNAAEYRLPGAWARAGDETSPAFAGDAAARARAAGLTPMPAESIGTAGLLPLLGLYRRAELVDAAIRGLETVRAGLPAGGLQAEFDLLFRPRGRWLVDLHDAALERARLRLKNLELEDARPALESAGQRGSTGVPASESLRHALYRLATLRQRDSAAFSAAWERLGGSGPAAFQAAAALLDGYEEAAEWHARALDFLLTRPWVQDRAGRTSISVLIARAWGQPEDRQLRIRTWYFGRPDGAPRVAVPADRVRLLVAAENWTAGQWASRHGPAGVLAVLRTLDPGLGPSATLETPDGPARLTSVAREARTGATGFLELVDEILIDPGFVPLLALGTVVHEWQHLLMERARYAFPEGAPIQPTANAVLVRPSDLFLAEGLAEWMTARILAPLTAEVPVLAAGESAKLAYLAASSPQDPHAYGLRMLDALEAALGDAVRVRELVVRHSTDPGAVAAEVSRWRETNVPDRVLPARGQRRVVPETVFTVEDGVADVVETRIRVIP